MPAPPSDIKQPDRKLKARGLMVYISDIRNCTNREQEEERVNEELANIRAKLSMHKSTKPLSSYDKRKYVWKLVYTHLLGYNVDFGHIQAIELLTGTSYQEKMCGYLALTVLLHGADDMTTLLVNTIKRDLALHNPDQVICLALCAVANTGGRDMAHALSDDIRKVVLNESLPHFARKKAILALLRLHRDAPEVVRLPNELQLASILDPPSHRHGTFPLRLSTCALLKHLIEYNNAERYDENEDETEDREEMERLNLQMKQRPQTQTLIVRTYHNLSVYKACAEGYSYHGTAAPFLQVALLRCLRALNDPPSAPEIRDQLFEALRTSLVNVKWTKSSTVNNSSRCVAFEALALIAQYPISVFAKTDLIDVSTDLLGKFVASKNSNTRYLALGAMTRIARAVAARYSSPQEAATDRWQRALTSQQNAIVGSLKDPDTSVRRRALDLLFHVCNEANAHTVIKELLTNLRLSPDLTAEIKEEMVLRIAVLAERYTKSPTEYINLAVELLEAGDEYVGDDVWHRVVQIISNQEDVQQYAALRLYKALLSPNTVPSSLVKVAAYVVGEFGYLLTEYSTLETGDLDHDVTGLDLFGACHKHFAASDTVTKIVLLTTYSKLLNIYEDLEAPVEEVFEQQQRSIDCEVQERAQLYLFLARVCSKDTMHRVLEPMPPWMDASRNKLEEHLDRITKDQTSAASPKAVSSPRRSSSSKSPVSKKGIKRKQPPEPLFDLDGDEAPPPPPRPVPNSPSSLLLAQTQKLYLNALLTPKSLLFDDGKCQIGSHQRFSRGEATVELFIGNLSQTIGYESVFFEIANPDPNALQLNIPEGARRHDRFFLAPSAQLQFAFQLRCIQPFLYPPELILVDGTTQHHLARLKLPVTLSSFMEPFSMTGQVFQAKWDHLEATPAQCLETSFVPLLSPGTVAFTSAIAKATKLIDLLRLYRIPDWPLESEAAYSDLAGAGVLYFAGSPNPAGVMLRVRVSGSLVQVSIRATMAEAAQNLISIISQQVTRLFREE